jgi:hypoxanthine phosphoribosyltransferase
MQHVVIVRKSGVITFDRASFEEVCAELMRLVDAHQPPDAIVGIRTGGFHVAEAMAREAGGKIPVLPLTCRRASSGLKSSLPFARDMIAMLPRPVLDRLRIAEHAIMMRRNPTQDVRPYHFDEDELSAIEAWMAESTRPRHLLIADDAVDSGTTLSRVFNALRELAAPSLTIQSAVITVTTNRPIMSPDYALYRRQLCRFPWSLDAVATTS